MSTIYLVSNYGELHKKGETLQLINKDGSTKKIFPFKTEQLIVMGRVNITSSAINLLMRYNVDTIFLGRNGKYNGKIAFQTGKNVFLRQKQFKLVDDQQFPVEFSKSVVKGKLKNQLTLIQSLLKKQINNKTVKNSIDQLKNLIKKIETASSVDQIRGYEGVGAKYMFSCFKYAIYPEWAKFNGRSMHPPKDNVNAVLSFLYTLILFRVDAAIESAGLDPYVGYLHTLDYGKRSLTFDLMEEYRTPIADRLAIALFNKNILEWDDFTEVIFSKDSDDFPLSEEENGEELEENIVIEKKKGVLLTKKGIKKVITHFENRIETQIFYKPLMERVSYRKLILEQIKHFKRVVTGEEKIYKPLTIK